MTYEEMKALAAVAFDLGIPLGFLLDQDAPSDAADGLDQEKELATNANEISGLAAEQVSKEIALVPPRYLFGESE